MVTCCPVNCKLHLKKILIEKITGKWPTPTIKARRLHFLIFCQCSAVLERIFLCQKVLIFLYIFASLWLNLLETVMWSWHDLSSALTRCTAPPKMKFSIKDFFSKRDQIRSFLRIRSHLLKKSLLENFIFCAVM